jgi:branched-chain amino acid transport system substrate-binding protein
MALHADTDQGSGIDKLTDRHVLHARQHHLSFTAKTRENSHMRTTFSLLSAAGMLALVATACGTSTSTSSGGGSGLAGCTGSVTVATDLPTSGGDAAIGGGTENGAHLAVMQAQQNKLFGGCTINYIAKDDASVALGKHDPAQGAANMTELANNPAVVGVIGAFNSGVTKAELPISSAAGLVQISPANTDPGLTIPGSDPDIDTASLHKNPSGRNTYFRVISNDTVQALVMSTYAIKTLNLKKFYDISDNETYGKDLSNYFDKDVQQLGGTVVKRDDTTDYSPEKFQSLLTGAVSLNPDAIFYGGVASNGSGVLWTAMQNTSLKSKTYLSGDGTVDPQFFKDTGAAASNAPNVYASSAPDATHLSSASAFNRTYKSTFGTDPVAYSAYGFDSMNILLQAVKKVLLNNGGKLPSSSSSFRAQVEDAVAATNYDGAIGHTQFDSRGDTLNHSFSIYIPQNGAWVAKGQPISA